MSEQSDLNNRREIYIIAHGCNSLSKIDKAIQQGANAIECDLWSDGRKWWVSHGGLFKTDLANWLKHIADKEENLVTQLSLVVFDIKSQSSFTAARTIINALLPKGLPRLYSTPKIAKASIFLEFIPNLKPFEILGIDQEDNPAKVAAFFKQHGVSTFWYGNGISYIPINEPYHKAMQQAADIRDNQQSISKIYTWTVHRKSALRKYLLHDGVDGVMVDLNNFFTSPVRHALSIIRHSDSLVLATRTTPLNVRPDTSIRL